MSQSATVLDDGEDIEYAHDIDEDDIDGEQVTEAGVIPESEEMDDMDVRTPFPRLPALIWGEAVKCICFAVFCNIAVLSIYTDKY
jgi:hypothetical protein